MAAIVGGHERSTGGRRASADRRALPHPATCVRGDRPRAARPDPRRPPRAGHEASRRGSSQPASGSAGRLCGRRSARSRRAGSSSRAWGSGTFVAERDALEQAPTPRPTTALPSSWRRARARGRGRPARRCRRPARQASRSCGSASRPRAGRGSEALPDELDRDFHRGIVGLTGNEHLIALLEPMWDTMRQALYTTLGRRSWSPQHTQRTAVEHRAIYEALRAGDPELAAFAMERHLRALMATLFEDEAFEARRPASPRGLTHVHRHRWDRPADHGDGLLATPVLVHEQPRAARRRTHSPTPGTARSSPTPWRWSSPTRSARASTSSRTATTISTPISAAGRGCRTRSSGFRVSRLGRRSRRATSRASTRLAARGGLRSWRLPPVV